METSVSLLERIRRSSGDSDWGQLVGLYDPLIRLWIRRYSSAKHEVDDVVQEILTVVVRKLPDFERARLGSFRSWLRTITVNCLRDSWRSKRFRPLASGGSDFHAVLDQLADPCSELSQVWNDEYDQHVLQSLLEQVRHDFSEPIWQSFWRVAVSGESVERVSSDLGVSVNSVYIARSRVMSRLRQLGQGLIE
ncbi:MAG: sigma-70 family RNA polymerase sigma factor [Planctomycetaceae bacterium]|nr:sigma-70 family RNA polymerase sigma factor [Planctomycetaceae bacterium]